MRIARAKNQLTEEGRITPSYPLVYLTILIMTVGLFNSLSVSGQSSDTKPDKPTHVVGTIQDMSAQTVIVKRDSGESINVSTDKDTIFLRVSPSESDLKNAVTIKPTGLAPGDRILVQGYTGADHTMSALRVIVIKQTDVAQREQHDREDWQKRGVGGIVQSVDPQSHQIKLSGSTGNPTVVVTSNQTRFWRYADDSVMFSAAKRAKLDQIRPGDQMRALGDRAVGSDAVSAEQVVFGSFRNIAGTASVVDTQNRVVRVMDLITKTPVDVQINDSTQIRKLPSFLAQGLASLVKHGDEQAAAEQGHSGAPDKPAQPAASAHKPPDLQHLLGQAPKDVLNNLQKGDALMIVSTSSSTPGGPSSKKPASSNTTEPAVKVVAITILTGVEPILTASPTGTGAASLLSGWDISNGPGESSRR